MPPLRSARLVAAILAALPLRVASWTGGWFRAGR